MAGLLLASILSDTVVFRSPTATDKDRLLASRLAPLAGVDASALGEEMLRIKATAAERRSPAQIVQDDLKTFELDGVRVGIAQVEVQRPAALADRRAAIEREMRALREAAGLTQVILMITDVQAKGSELWFVGERADLFERAFGPSKNATVHLPGCMSRKKEVVPRLEDAFTESAERSSNRGLSAADHA
jgi:manganese-dependent inorganic pyrophosphatase